MRERKRILLLIVIMATASLIVVGITISILYLAAYEEEQARLVETAQSQARLIEAIARFDARYSKDYPEGPVAATLNQIVDAHEHYKGFGETGEFTLARREGDYIVFLLHHRHYDLKNLKPVPFDSELAEPMRRALSGLSGTVVGFDYRGEVVLAAHEPVSELNLGIVAKIDLAEIRAPFVRAGVIAGGLAILVVLAGAALFVRISNPMIRRLEEHSTKLAEANEQLKSEIDERRRAEEALRESEEKYRNLFEHANDSIFIIDPSTRRFLDANENAVKRLGYNREELLRLTIDDIDTPMAAQRNDAIIRELLDTGNVTFEHAHLHKNGTQMPVEISSRIMEYGGRRVFQSVVRDITERKRAEVALRESEKRYRDLYENAPNAYFSISAVDGSVLRCNSAALQLLGYDKKIITKMDVLDLYADTPHGISKAREILKHFQAGESIQDIELQMKRKDGQPIWISLTVEPLKDEDGNVVESRSMVINISERKRAEEALQKARDELERRVEERTAELRQEIRERKQAEEALRESESHLRYLSSQLLTAHEDERKRIALELHDSIGQTLSALKFSVENSLKQMGDSDIRACAQAFERTIPLIQESIEEVRKIAMELRPSVLDDLGILATISWFCREFQKIYSVIRIKQQIGVQEDEIPGPLKTVIYRVLQEALNNVAKHSEADVVRLSLKKRGGTLELAVEDNGLGFNPKETFAVKNSTRGFGLASMKERTQLSGGSFSIKSAKGAGTTVRARWGK
jgi:PAS domain S-box-containing protein